MKLWIGKAGIGLALLACCLLAQAQTATEPVAAWRALYNNFSPGKSKFDWRSGLAVATATSEIGTRQSVGLSFDVDADATIRKIVVAVGLASGADGLNLSLRSDDAGLPGAVIERFRLTDLPPLGKNRFLRQAVLTQGIPVRAGERYWIVLGANADTFASWNLNAVGVVGEVAFKNDDTGWQLRGPYTVPALSVLAE